MFSKVLPNLFFQNRNFLMFPSFISFSAFQVWTHQDSDGRHTCLLAQHPLWVFLPYIPDIPKYSHAFENFSAFVLALLTFLCALLLISGLVKERSSLQTPFKYRFPCWSFLWHPSTNYTDLPLHAHHSTHMDNYLWFVSCKKKKSSPQSYSSLYHRYPSPTGKVQHMFTE